MFSWLEHALKTDLETYKLLAVFISMVLESACIPIPSEVVMPYAGHLVARGSLGMLQTTLVAGFANLTGSWIAYFVGRYGGRAFIDKYGKYVFLSTKHLRQAEKWFKTRGEATVFFSRMLPAVRTFISLPAGIAKMDFLKFSLYSFLGSLPWNFVLVYLGYIFTDRWNDLQQYLHDFNYLAIGLVIFAAIMFLYFRKKRRK